MHSFLTDRNYTQLTDRAKATRALDFKKLQQMGLIVRQGKGPAPITNAGVDGGRPFSAGWNPASVIKNALKVRYGDLRWAASI